MDFKLNICLLLLLLGVLSVQGKNEPHVKAKRQGNCEDNFGYCVDDWNMCSRWGMEHCRNYQCYGENGGYYCCCRNGEYGWGK